MTSGGWIISHRCSWILVYVLCCNAQVNLIVIFMTCTCIALHSLFCQLPNCNLITQHVIYLYGQTPLVNCGPRSILLHIYYHLLSTSIIYFLGNKYLLPHDTFCRFVWCGHVRCPVLQRQCQKTAKRWAKTWKRATSGENGQASLNVTQTRKLPRAKAETPKNG
jgi:hypothetical protein